MIEKTLKGGKAYWTWVGVLSAFIVAGFICYLIQLKYGLAVTGMGRDISWGLYIANFTFLVGVAASAVIVVLPYYLHSYKQFGKITIFGRISCRLGRRDDPPFRICRSGPARTRL